jgi:HK97 family phage major capsid protein
MGDNPKVLELRSRIGQIETELRSIHTTAGDNPFTDEQQTKWDALNEERSTVAKEKDDLETRLSQVARFAAAPGHIESTTPDPLGEPRSIRDDAAVRKVWDLDAVSRALHRDSPERGGAELRSRALDAVEKAPALSDRSRERVTSLLQSFDFEDEEAEGVGARTVAAHVIATSSPEYMRAWSKAFKTGMRTGQPDYQAMQVLQRAASLTDAAGGYAVPLPVDPTLILNDNGSVSPLRRISTVRTVVTDQLRTVNATAVSASYDGEAAEVSDDTPTWANTDISIFMARAFIPHSIEIGMDYPNFTSDVAFLLDDAKVNLENTKFALGSGTNEPVGIVTALTGGSFELASASTDTLALADVYKLDEELPERYYDDAQWLGHKKIYSALRQAGGANLDDFWANLGQGQPAQLLGHDVNNASAMDGIINASQENRVLILGDFKFFWIVDRVGFSVELIPHLFHTSNNRPAGQRGVFAYWRNGSDSVNDRAFRMLNVT